MRGFAYPRPAKVRAVQFTEPGELRTKEGKTYQYKTTDWCLSDLNDSEHKWVIDADIFEDTYNHVADDIYKKRARKTFFEIADDDGAITTMEGPMKYRAGDYILTGLQNEKYPMSAARFNQKYYRVQLEKAAMFKNLTIDISKMMPDAGIPEHAALIGYSDFQALRLMSVEQAAGVTTSVGKLGMYLMYFGILAFLKDKKAEPGAQLVKDLKEAHSRLPLAELGKLGVKKSMLMPSTDPDYLRNQLIDFREANRTIRDDTRIPEAERKLLTLALRVSRADVSESAVRQLEKAAWIISPELGAKVLKYATGVKTTADSKAGSLKLKTMHAALASQVKQLGGSGYTLSLDKAVAARENRKTIGTYNEYLALRREIKKIFDVEFKKLIVNNSNKPMDADEASKKMTAMGFAYSLVPDSKMGFVGRVGIDAGKMALYTSSGTKLMLNGITPGATVKMNPKFDPEDEGVYYMHVKAPGATGVQRIYTTKNRQESTKLKFQKADNLEKILPRLIQAWKRDLQSAEPLTWMKATAAVVLYLTGARVGSNVTGMTSKKGVEGFGILNLRIRHIKFTPTSVIFDYAGAKGKGAHIKHIIPLKDPANKLVGKHLKELVAGKGKEDLIFSVPAKTKGKMTILTFNLFSKYLKSNGFTMGAHKLRHVRGTATVRKLLAVKDWKPSKTANTLAKRQREAENWIKTEVLVKVAKILGHQTKSRTTGATTPAWQTSIKSYINPDIVRQWFLSKKLDVPNWVPGKLDT